MEITLISAALATAESRSRPAAMIDGIFFMAKVYIDRTAGKRATSAAPSFFNPIKLGELGDEFMDGATGSNNPIRDVWLSAKELWHPDDPHFKDEIHCMLSIGTGVAADQAFGPQFLSVAKALTNIATETEDTAAGFEREHRDLQHSRKYFRFNVPYGLGSIGLEEYSKFGEISSHTNGYLKRPAIERDLETCAEVLLQRHQSRAGMIDALSYASTS